jgi:hypothetical protein
VVGTVYLGVQRGDGHGWLAVLIQEMEALRKPTAQCYMYVRVITIVFDKQRRVSCNRWRCIGASVDVACDMYVDIKVITIIT